MTSFTRVFGRLRFGGGGLVDETRKPEPIVSPDGNQYWDGEQWQLLPPEPRVWTGSAWIASDLENASLSEPAPYESTFLYWATRSPQVFLVAALGVVLFVSAAMLLAFLLDVAGGASSTKLPVAPPAAAASPSVTESSEVRDLSPSPASASTASTTGSASSSRSSVPEQSFESALQPYTNLENAEIWFYMLCNEPPVPGNPYDGIDLEGGEASDEIAGFEVVMKLLNLGNVTVDAFWGADTDSGLKKLLATLGMPADQGIDWQVLRRTQEIVCWDDMGSGLFQYWVDVWPAGLDALEAGTAPTREIDQTPDSREFASLERLWDGSSSDFRLAQCRLWGQNPEAFVADSIIAFEASGNSRLVDEFMSRVC